MICDRPIEDDFLFLIYDVAQLMKRHADKRARLRGMTRAQWAVLARIDRQPGITQSELAHLTDVEPITVGRLIDRLEAAGFLERRPDPSDRRVWRLRLTSKSSSVLREIGALRKELHQTMSRGIDVGTLDTLTEGLQRMRKNLSINRADDIKDVVQ
jgi:MarR family transcriptional regulator, transcriptional regulator for hemolysin